MVLSSQAMKRSQLLFPLTQKLYSSSLLCPIPQWVELSSACWDYASLYIHHSSWHGIFPYLPPWNFMTWRRWKKEFMHFVMGRRMSVWELALFCKLVQSSYASIFWNHIVFFQVMVRRESAFKRSYRGYKGGNMHRSCFVSTTDFFLYKKKNIVTKWVPYVYSYFLSFLDGFFL